jgi:aryl-alcohol dehydrogenase-like predicted oxidoreductase
VSPAGGPTSRLGYGAFVLGGPYGDVDDAAAIEVLTHAVQRGVTHFDTADVYGAGRSDELLGRAMKGCREQVVIATKFGAEGNLGPHGLDGTPENARRVLEQSLRRLDTDYIDLWYPHRLDPAVPVEETIGAMAEAVAEGKVRYLGVCEPEDDELPRSMAVHPIAALQCEYSLLHREAEHAGLAEARRIGALFVAFSPLSRGLLSASAPAPSELPEDDRRASLPRFTGENYAHNRDLVGQLEGLAGELAVTPAQLALAWLLHQGEDVLPIPGTRVVGRLDENLAAADLQLDAATLERLDRLFPIGAVAGDQY